MEVQEAPKPQPADTTLGELIASVYAEFLELYGDEELASVATAAVVNDMLTAQQSGQAPDC